MTLMIQVGIMFDEDSLLDESWGEQNLFQIRQNFLNRTHENYFSLQEGKINIASPLQLVCYMM